MPDQINKILVDGTTYQVTPSDTGTFNGTSEDATNPSSWTDVAVLSSGETNGSIFTKISSMFKNIRYLYSKLGSIDISTTGNSITDAIANLETNKADSNHTHSIATTAAAGFMPALDNTDTTKFLRADGVWGKPAGEEYDIATSAANGLMSSTDKHKLDYVEDFANNYSHPVGNPVTIGFYKIGSDDGYHPMGWMPVQKSDITELGIPDSDTTYATFQGATTAEGSSRGLVPAAGAGAVGPSGRFLNANGSWLTPDVGLFQGISTTTQTGVKGLVPGPQPGSLERFLSATGNWEPITLADANSKGLMPALSGTATQFLNGNGSWSTPTNTTYATFTSAANGLVPAAKSGSTNYATSAYVLTGAGWQAGTKYNTDTNTTYAVMGAATSAAAGTSGLVPAPAAGKQASYLRGDKTWAVPTNTTYTTFTTCTTNANGAVGLVPAPSSSWASRKNYIYLRASGGWSYLPTATTAEIGGVKLNGNTGTYLNGNGAWTTPTNTTYATNTSGVKGVYSNGTLTLSALTVRV